MFHPDGFLRLVRVSVAVENKTASPFSILILSVEPVVNFIGPTLEPEAEKSTDESLSAKLICNNGLLVPPSRLNRIPKSAALTRCSGNPGIP